jgi:hypothetical protein
VRLSAELQATGGTTTGFRIPDEAVAELGGGGRPKVALTVAGHTFRGSIARMGDAHWFGISAARRAEAGIAAGETHELEVVLDDAPRAVELPAELAAAFHEEPALAEAWAALSYSKQRAHAEPVEAAKKPETRAARVAKVLAALRG